MRSALLSFTSHRRALPRRIRLLTSVLFGLTFLLAWVGEPLRVPVLSRPAYAAGKVTLSARELVEADGKWKLNMAIDYGGTPHVPHIAMLFSFTPTALYERALTDKTGDKPILNKIPLQNQQSINEPIDVGFSDASGKVFKVTKFDFAIRRDHGFEAGEYDLKITRSDDGVQMGQTIKLILKGDNPIVDRRAITFAGEKKPKKDDKAAGGGDEKKAEGDKPAESAENKAEEKAETPPEDPNAPPPVPPKQGGCGCRVDGASGPFEGAAGLLAIGLGVALSARRRARR
jgi:MYXO-CTERM domain-containing protein